MTFVNVFVDKKNIHLYFLPRRLHLQQIEKLQKQRHEYDSEREEESKAIADKA